MATTLWATAVYIDGTKSASCAFEIDRQCQTMIHKIECTCALKFGGCTRKVGMDLRWFAPRECGAGVHKDEVRRCIGEFEHAINAQRGDRSALNSSEAPSARKEGRALSAESPAGVPSVAQSMPTETPGPSVSSYPARVADDDAMPQPRSDADDAPILRAPKATPDVQREHSTAGSSAQPPDADFSEMDTARVERPLTKSTPATGAGVQSVEVKGFGESADAARTDAARLAIQQVVGVFVDNRRRVVVGRNVMSATHSSW